MQITGQIRLPGSISAVALDASGGRAAVAVGMSPRYLYRPPGEPPEPRLHSFRVSGGRLTAHETPAVFPDYPDLGRLEDAKLAFLNERTLLVAARAVRGVTDEEGVLLALDLTTGRERGRWVGPGSGERLPADLVPVPPRHALLGLSNNVVCVDMEMFGEVCRARDVDDEGDVVEEGAAPEEQLAPNGHCA